MSNATGCSTPAKQQKLDGVSSRGARPRWALKQQLSLCSGCFLLKVGGALIYTLKGLECLRWFFKAKDLMSEHLLSTLTKCDRSPQRGDTVQQSCKSPPCWW